MHSGSCLCGTVHIGVDAILDLPIACHCNICRKMTDHYLVSTDMPLESLASEGTGFVNWFHSSENVRVAFVLNVELLCFLILLLRLIGRP